MSTDLLLDNVCLYSEQGVISPGAIWLSQAKIAALGNSDQIKHWPLAKDCRRLVLTPEFKVIPGFIDLHIHGAKDADVMDASAEALACIAQALAEQGTTAFLATTMTASAQSIEQALKQVAHYVNPPGQAELIGVHLEGPFLSPGKVGAQNPEHLLSPDVELLLAWQQLAAGKIKLVTLAPELDKGLALTKVLQQQGIIAAIGHTEADYHCAKQAIDAGACHATHLFNAMPQLHHRRPGATAALLLDDRVTAELIVDHHHVHPAMVDLAIKAKGFEGLVLVSDAMRAQCLGDGVYDLGGQQVTVEAGQARLTNGALAGSVVTLGQAVKNICQRPDYDLTNALTMAAANPAKQLGIFHRKGSLAIGKDADLVIINKAGEVVFTLCRGVIAVDRL